MFILTNIADSFDFDIANDVWINKTFRFENYLFNNNIVTVNEFNKIRNDCYYNNDFNTWDKIVTKWYKDYYSKRFIDKIKFF